MKTKLLLILLLMTSYFFAQTNQFTYKYIFKIDSLNRDKSESENMVLETSSSGSKFFSQVKYVYDSTMTATFKKAKMTQNNHFDFSGLKHPKVNFEVTKTYPDYKRTLKKNIGPTRLALSNDNKIDWKISDEKDKVLGYDVQKATANWRGRNWIAWFAPEIPLQDGPHEFSGLPGLILKIKDSKGDHSFTLIGSKKVTIENESYAGLKAREIAVNEEKFKKYWNDYKKDPVKDMRQAVGSSGSSTAVVSMSFGGKTYSQEEMMRELEKTRKEELKKVNNFIELDLYR